MGHGSGPVAQTGDSETGHTSLEHQIVEGSVAGLHEAEGRPGEQLRRWACLVMRLASIKPPKTAHNERSRLAWVGTSSQQPVTLGASWDAEEQMKLGTHLRNQKPPENNSQSRGWLLVYVMSFCSRWQAVLPLSQLPSPDVTK